MIKKLHAHSKIFFPRPYVVRIEYPNEMLMEQAEIEYRKVYRRAYRLLKGTWGYCQLEAELIKVKDEVNHPTTPGPSHFAGMAPTVFISSLFNPDHLRKIRGYLCFTDELDALQFRLSISSNSVQVYMWPERWFTIHEVVETDGS